MTGKLKRYFYSSLLPVLLVLFNLLLKIRYVSYPSLAKDEPFSVYYSQFSLSTIIAELSEGNNPPLYEIILHFWTSLFGISEFSVRIPSVLFSSLTVYFIYLITRRYFGVKTGVLAAVLFSLSNYQLYFAHEARVYPLFMLLTVISMTLFLKLLRYKDSRALVYAFITINVLLLYSHFFSWFILVIEFASILVLYRKNKKELLRFVFYLGWILLFYLPYLGVFVSRFIDSSGGTWIETVSNLRPLVTFFSQLINDTNVAYTMIMLFIWIYLQKYINQYFSHRFIRFGLIVLSILFFGIFLSIRLPIIEGYNDFSAVLIIASCIVFFVGLYTHFVFRSESSVEGKIILTWLFVPGIIIFTASFTLPMFIDRYLIFLTPAFFIILAVLISKLDPKLFWSLSLFTITLMAVSFSPLSNNERDVKTMVNFVKSQQTENTAVFICPDYHGFTFTYYYDRFLFENTKSDIPEKDMEQGLNKDNVYLVRKFDQVDSVLSTNDFGHIVYVDAGADFSYSDNGIKHFLRSKVQKDTARIDSLYIPGIYTVYTFDTSE